MKCHSCNTDTVVVDSRKKNGGVWRRRECPQCETRFNTIEAVDSGPAPRLVQRVQPTVALKPKRKAQPKVAKAPNLKVVKQSIWERRRELQEQQELAALEDDLW